MSQYNPRKFWMNRQAYTLCTVIYLPLLQNVSQYIWLLLFWFQYPIYLVIFHSDTDDSLKASSFDQLPLIFASQTIAEVNKSFWAKEINSQYSSKACAPNIAFLELNCSPSEVKKQKQTTEKPTKKKKKKSKQWEGNKKLSSTAFSSSRARN